MRLPVSTAAKLTAVKSFVFSLPKYLHGDHRAGGIANISFAAWWPRHSGAPQGCQYCLPAHLRLSEGVQDAQLPGDGYDAVLWGGIRGDEGSPIHGSLRGSTLELALSLVTSVICRTSSRQMGI